MGQAASAFLFLGLLAGSVFGQTTPGHENGKPVHDSPSPNAAAGSVEDNKGIELLKIAEAEAAALDGEMRAWMFWQIGIGYQTTDRAKALELFETAFISTRTVREESSAKKPIADALARFTGRPLLSPALRLQADIARSIVLLDPKRSDQLLQQVDPAVRAAVLESVLAHQEKEQQFDQALETLNRITAHDEMPYEGAMRLMDTLKPEQSGELMRLFIAALASYHDHPPHSQVRDIFPIMLFRYWNRLPKEVAREATDEILKQAVAADVNGSYGVSSEKGTATLGSLYQYRLFQLMPVLRQLDPAAADKYMEKYPALSNSVTNASASTASSDGGASFHPSSGYRTVMTSMAEMPAAKKAAAKMDSGHADEAMSEAASIVDLNLRAQVYEYIARVASRKQGGIAGEAIKSMLEAAETLQPRDAFPYYVSAAEIYLQMNDPEAAKKSIESGFVVANKLYQADSDQDDPNTALKAFWPSTNAYCAMLRQAARISDTWAIALLKDIKDPEIKVATETALAGGLLNAPLGPSTIMTTKKNSNSISFNGRD